MVSSAQIDDLHSMIEKFLRRLKGDVERIPPREETIIEVELTIEQKRYYRATNTSRTASTCTVAYRMLASQFDKYFNGIT